jgi:hypothetical protein
MPPMQQGRPQGGGEHHRHDRQFRRDHGRHRERYNDRGDRDRQHGGPGEHREPMPPQERSVEAGGDGDPRRRDRFQPQHEQPDFLRRPVRRARTEEGEPGKDD